MKKVLHINVTAGCGSTGTIAENIAREAALLGFENMTLFGRGDNKSDFPALRVGTAHSFLKNAVSTRLFDRHGMSLAKETRKALKNIDKSFKPDLVHLHNIHGYWINISTLFEWLRERDVPMIWTLHDCWPMTGHCAHFLPYSCLRWETGCHDCVAKNSYPASRIADRSAKNYILKKRLFTSISRNLTVVSVSEWLDSVVARSFLNVADRMCIHNGVDTSVFKPSPQQTAMRERFGVKQGEKVVLCAASKWTTEKGAEFLPEIAASLPDDFRLTIVGKTPTNLRNKLSDSNIIMTGKISDVDELCNIYNLADCMINPTLADTLPTVNLEAQSCGTPVATFNTGGCGETVGNDPEFYVRTGDIAALTELAVRLAENKKLLSSACRKNIIDNFAVDSCLKQYAALYEKLS